MKAKLTLGRSFTVSTAVVALLLLTGNSAYCFWNAANLRKARCNLCGPSSAPHPLGFTATVPNLYHYGYRYYNPSTGRWLSRDRIGERAGLNLSALLANTPINDVDKDGLQCWVCLRPMPMPIPIDELPIRPPLPPTTMPPLYRPIPVVPPQTPPTPNPNPPPTPSPDPTPSPQPGGPLPPDQGGPPWPYGPDGDCTPARKRFLQHQKDAICNQPRSCNPKKCPQDDVGEIWRRIRINEACIKARENIMNECYRGGNKAHKDEVQNVRDVLEKCRRAFEAAGGVSI